MHPKSIANFAGTAATFYLALKMLLPKQLRYLFLLPLLVSVSKAALGREQSTTSQGYHLYIDTSITGIGYMDSSSIVGIWGSSSSRPAIIITPEQTVGIGTLSPQANFKLDVRGDAIFNKVKVQANTAWPDFVFAPSYHLPSLGYVERFVKTYRHLPGVPSAAQVQKDKLDLGDNQALLLQKIEELTLYLIDLNKRIEQLEKEKTAASNK